MSCSFQILQEIHWSGNKRKALFIWKTKFSEDPVKRYYPCDAPNRRMSSVIPYNWKGMSITRTSGLRSVGGSSEQILINPVHFYYGFVSVFWSHFSRYLSRWPVSLHSVLSWERDRLYMAYFGQNLYVFERYQKWLRHGVYFYSRAKLQREDSNSFPNLQVV